MLLWHNIPYIRLKSKDLKEVERTIVHPLTVPKSIDSKETIAAYSKHDVDKARAYFNDKSPTKLPDNYPDADDAVNVGLVWDSLRYFQTR